MFEYDVDHGVQERLDEVDVDVELAEPHDEFFDVYGTGQWWGLEVVGKHRYWTFRHHRANVLQCFVGHDFVVLDILFWTRISLRRPRWVYRTNPPHPEAAAAPGSIARSPCLATVVAVDGAVAVEKHSAAGR